MTHSYISHLHCSRCDKQYLAGEKHQLCSCGAPLLVSYKLDQIKAVLQPQTLQSRPPNLWRYHELLPVQDLKHIVSLGEGMTPLIRLPVLEKQYGIKSLFMKDEGIIPTGTFKARGAAVGVSMALELGVDKFAMPTNGNAGSAWSLYAARAGIESIILMPVGAPSITRKEVSISGARLYLVNGLISDAGKIVAGAIDDYQLYDVSTLKEPYRLEGKKTMGLEIAEQLDWELPDVILYPTGGGVGIIGIYKALQELKSLGWLKTDKMPRLVAVQSEGCAPIVKAWEAGLDYSEYWENSETIAFGINVPKALGDFLVLQAIYETQGCAIAVDDRSLLAAQKSIAENEGAFICPEGAATLAAVDQLRENNWIKAEETVVILNTGTGIKYPNTVEVSVPTLEPGSVLKL